MEAPLYAIVGAKLIIVNQTSENEYETDTRCLYAHFLETEVGVARCNGLPHAVGERVEHGVVWVNRWQAVPLQLVLNNLNQPLHPAVVLSPVTNNLQT